MDIEIGFSTTNGTKALYGNVLIAIRVFGWLLMEYCEYSSCGPVCILYIKISLQKQPIKLRLRIRKLSGFVTPQGTKGKAHLYCLPIKKDYLHSLYEWAVLHTALSCFLSFWFTYSSAPFVSVKLALLSCIIFWTRLDGHIRKRYFIVE